MKRVILWMCLVAIVPVLVPASVVASEIPVREDADDLSLEYAQYRRMQVRDIAYDLAFQFRRGADSFEGEAQLQVHLNHTEAPLSIDLTAKEVHSVAVNGVIVGDRADRAGSFDIPVEHLRAGKNLVTVRYTGFYSDTGQGLCHFVDPVDGKEYFYTNLEPYGAHRVFPCLDQPDIKATYTTRVTAPSDWRIIGNERIVSGMASGDNNVRRIGKTPLLSTYLYFIGGGDYEVWRDQHGDTPLAIYARASLAEYMDSERLFQETKAGLDHFNAYFETPYPFDKYDHVFAPELRAGAMENPGAVTMNESMIFRGPATDERYRSRNNTLLHEMAHMWFGDLVTMVWWNDLWLNESFATFSAYQAQAMMGGGTTAWRDFFDLKGWAYYQDQLSTTHPIETHVPSAMLATANFDGITYAKGASALKQLAFYVGDDAYQAGVADYFRRYPWQNTTRAQFVNAIAEAAQTDLDLWTERWLKTEGLSLVSVEQSCSDGLLSNAILTQTPLNAPRLSPHKTQVGLFNVDDLGGLVLQREIPVRYEAEQTVIDVPTGAACPDFLFPNYGDMDYGLFFLDEGSFKTAKAHVNGITDPFTRQMVWGTFFNMVRHLRLDPVTLMEVVVHNVLQEPDPDLLDFVIGGNLSQLYYQFLLPEDRSVFAPKLEALIWKGFEESPAESDERLNWRDAFIRYATSAEAIARLETLLHDTDLDQPRRWRVLQRLSALGVEGMDERVAAELESDPTDQGQRAALACHVAVPTPENKSAHWESFTKGSLPSSTFTHVAGAFHNTLSPELTESFREPWLAYVRNTDWEQESHHIRTWFGSLFPPIHTASALAENRAALNAATLTPHARRAWQEALDRAKTVLNVRENQSRD